MNFFYDDFIDSNFIDNLLKNGFDCGRKYNSSETMFDMEALDRLFADYNVSEDSQREFLENWLPKRFKYIFKNTFSNLQKDGEYIHIYRNIFLKNDDVNKFLDSDEPLGEYWTCEDMYIEGWGDNSDENHIMIHSLVKENDIDWKTTILRNMNYLYGDDEKEISLTSEVFVKILDITVNGDKQENFKKSGLAGNKIESISLAPG